jgi:hypothetical protein
MARRIIFVETEEHPDRSELDVFSTMLRKIEGLLRFGRLPVEMPSYMELEQRGVSVGRFRIIHDK